MFPIPSSSPSQRGIEDFFNGEQLEEEPEAEELLMRAFNHPLVKEKITEFDYCKYETQYLLSTITQE